MRVGPGVLAAVLARFIRMKQMMVDGDVLDKSHRSRSYGYASRHIPPLNYGLRIEKKYRTSSSKLVITVRDAGCVQDAFVKF